MPAGLERLQPVVRNEGEREEGDDESGRANPGPEVPDRVPRGPDAVAHPMPEHEKECARAKKPNQHADATVVCEHIAACGRRTMGRRPMKGREGQHQKPDPGQEGDSRLEERRKAFGPLASRRAVNQSEDERPQRGGEAGEHRKTINDGEPARLENSEDTGEDAQNDARAHGLALKRGKKCVGSAHGAPNSCLSAAGTSAKVAFWLRWSARMKATSAHRSLELSRSPNPYMSPEPCEIASKSRAGAS